MKKFLAILTIVAMLSGMVVIGASADGAYAIDMDFTDYAGSTAGKHQNQNLNTVENGIARIEHGLGVYPIGNGAVSGDSALIGVDGAMQTKGFWIKVPEFFAGKSAGTYTIEFDYNSTASIYGYRLDVGSTLNQRIEAGSGWGGSAVFVTDKEGYNSNSIAVFGAPSSSGHALLTFEWDGTLIQPTTDGVGNLKVADYDIEALCIKVVASDSSVFTVDNLKVSNLLEKAEAALESTVAPYAVAPSFEEDFNDNYAYVGENTQYAHPNANTLIADYALVGKNIAEGLYAQGYSTDKPESAQFTLVERAEGDYAIEAPRVFLKIPNFFEGQAAGNYVVEFDVKLVGHTTGFYLQRLNVGATAGTNAVWFKGAEGFTTYGWLNPGISTTNTGWQSVKLHIPYSGSVTATTDTNCDVNALVLGFTPTTYNAATKYQFDNFKVYPVDNTTGTVVDYAGKDMVVNNTVYVNNGAPLNAEVISAAYDQNGNLRAVGTAPVAIDAGESSKAANVTIEEMPAGVTANWTFKSFLWSDLDNEIEPLYDAVNPFDANIKQSIGVEFNPVTEAPSTFDGTFVMAKDWVSNGAYCLTDYALNGRYSIYIPTGKSAYLADDGFLAANGEGTYTVRFWYNGGTLITRLHKDGKLHRHGATSGGGGYEAYSGGPTQVKENGDVVTKTVNGKIYYLHEAVLDTTQLYLDSSAEPQGFKFGAHNADAWVEVESIVFTPAQ